MKNLLDIWDDLLSHVSKKWGAANIDDISRIEFELQKAVPMKPIDAKRPSIRLGCDSVHEFKQCPICKEDLSLTKALAGVPKGCPKCRQALDFGE